MSNPTDQQLGKEHRERKNKIVGYFSLLDVNFKYSILYVFIFHIFI